MPMEQRRLVAVIDVGSNSVRLLVARTLGPAAFEVVDEERFDARLGEGLTAAGLAPAAFDRGLRALRVMVQVARSFGPSELFAVGTEALRRASDSATFIERVWRETGVRIRVLTGEEEAYAGFLGVVNSTGLVDGNVIDLGGGSLELMRVEARNLVGVRSAPLGALYATERYLSSDPPMASEVRALRKAVRQTFERQPAAGTLVGTGGAVRNLARMARLQRAYPMRRLHGFELGRREIRRFATRLASLSSDERRRVPGIGSNRVGTLAAAAVVIDELMDRLGAASLTVSGQGLREGVVWQVLRGFGAIVPDARAASIAGLAMANGVDELASEPVVLAAADLYAATQPAHGLAEADGELLRYGARLAGIGMHVDYYDRDRHAQYLIHSGDLRGFSHREIVLLGGLVKGATGGPPDLGPYRSLLRDGDARRVAVLAAILAAARAVHRRRPTPVLAFSPEVHGDRLKLRLRGGDSLEAEVHALEAPVRRLGTALGLSPEVVVERNGGAAGS